MPDAAGATRELASFVAGLGYASVPGPTRERATLIVADTIGVSLGGSTEQEPTALRGRLRHSPWDAGASLWCRGFPRVPPEDAALVNATQLAFLELDEGARPTGHPASHVLPPLLAVAESRGATGEAVLEAFIAGYEVQARIQRAARLRRRVHPHGNFGVVGAVAALGRLAGWDEDAMARGITVAAGLPLATSWEPCLSGDTVRNAFIGMAAVVALRVAQLVESGLSGHPDALEDTFGRILGEGFDAAALVDGLGRSFAVDANYFKFHAACALAHPALDALADAMDAERVTGAYPTWRLGRPPPPEAVAAVEVRVPERFARLDGQARPNQLSSKFSIPYAVAAFLVTGESGPDAFRGEALHDARLRALSRRVRVTGDEALSARWPSEAAASVTVRLADGEERTGVCANPFGSADNAPSEADLEAKFRYLGRGALEPELLDRLWTRCLALAASDDVGSLFTS